MYSFARPVLVTLLSLLPLAANSQGVTHYEEPGISAGREYVKQHVAERIDPFSGNLSLQFVDLVIPGNGGFDLKVQRSYNANATGEVKSPFGRGWQIHFGRVSHSANQLCAGASARTLAIQLPDGSSHVLFKSNGIGGTSNSLDYLSASLWKARCNSTEAGMTVTSPDGTKYDMTEVDGIYWHAKRITDRFGNYFDITYVTNGTAGRRVVSQVTANDGRSLNFLYSGDKLTSIQGGGNIWGYTVSTAADASNQLTQVNRPAGGNWTYAYNGNTGDAKSWLLTSMTNPYGGAVTYTYQLVQFMPGVVGGPPSLPAVNTKFADGKQWQYGFSPGCPSSGMDTTTVTQPDSIGQLVYKHYGHCSIGQGEVWKIGLLQEKKSGTLQTETYTWTPLAISNESTARPGYFTQDLQINRPLMASRTVARDGINYTTTNGNFDTFGNPQSIAESGTRSRNRTASYYNNVAAWIIGLIDDEGYTGVGNITRSRNASTGALLSESRFGVTTSYTYHSDGSVASMQTDKPATTTYSNYSRGVAQAENRPAGVTISRTVDSAGNVKAETDGQFTWGYDYDGIGRLTSIDYPTGSDATITWNSNSRVLTRGSYSETTQFDSFGRTTSVTRGGIAQTFGLDALGRETFRSMPGSSLGTTRALDVLGRVKTEVSSAGQKTYTYTSGDLSVSNERGFTTFYEFDRYGDPDEGFLVGIAAPETSASVDMVRNQVGVLMSATQNSVTRTYGRDTRFFLTSISEPETTSTTFGRDGVGNMTSKTVGGQTLTYGYDGLNRLESISGPGVSVAIGYNNRSKVTTVTNGSALRTYSYDTNGNLTEDRLSVDGQLFVVGYGYDTIDGLASITYPLTKGTVTYAPNALGRPTQASPYASSVGHHPSGNLSSIGYGNGVSQSFGENSRQLPSSISAGGVVGLTYGYDNGGNITSIVDSIAAETRTLNYDAIDRLTVAHGPWGSGSIDYSGSGNITRQTLGPYTINYAYSANRLASISGSVAKTFTYDGAGNMTNGANRVFDALAQMTCANCGTPQQAQYQYDGQGRRVIEDSAGRRTYFVQAPNGDLQFEYSPYGKRWTKHVYLHGKRIAAESGSDALASTASVGASPSSSTYGQAVTLTATVSPGAATGTVEFVDGVRSLGIVSVASGQAAVTISDMAVGSRAIVAKYSGDANYQPTTGSTNVTVAKRSATVALSGAPSTAAYGAAVTLTATVTGTGPTGQVQFKDGAQIIGTGNIASGIASFTTNPLAQGVHSFTATYLGDGNHNVATSSAVTTTVLGPPADLGVTQSVNVNPVGSGKDAIFTLVATNNGPNVASDVAVSATHDSATIAVWASPGCVHQPANYRFVCSTASLANGGSVQYKVVLRKPAAGSLTHNVVVASSATDSNASNNSAPLTVTVGATPAGQPVNRYRLYSVGTGAHLYTTDFNEYDTLGRYPESWVQEGIQGKVLNNPGSYNGVAAVPYYRLYDGNYGWHHWTTDANEYYTLVNYPGWNGEGADAYILPTAASSGTMALYRLVYPDGRGLHHWTTDLNEYNALIASYGWVGEGGAGHLIQ